MKKAIVAASLVVLTAAAALQGQQGYKSIRLVYHSDTRGYYQPCG